MIEAAMSGKKVLQLAECSEYTFENVPLLQANESIRQALKHTAQHARPQLFDHKKFEQFLRSVLTYP
jgi:glutaredoxin-related protein